MDKTENEPEATKAEAKLIQPINRESVHKICSGQVVLSLAIAMKELVENAIDATATRIEVKLKNYGADLIEVADNGTGIEKENFQTLTMKHYTSKIRQFSDLESLSTLGFRGEALSSLCALSNLTIITKHSGASLATKIDYDRNGKIVNESPIARGQGTTVILENLFATLPVRRKEFLKNLKKEFNKMCNLLYSYCLVSKGIRFSCVNITDVGSKVQVVETEGHKTVKENIISVFGTKQISSIIEIPLKFPDDEIIQEYGLKLTVGDELPFDFECLVSSVIHSSGRSTTDRQYYYINSRPCEPTKLIKLINQTYRQFNGSQYPFVYLNVTTKGTLVDVNVTPDKRQVFLEQEKLLLAIVKSSLLDAFKLFPSSYKVQNLDVSKKIFVIDKKKDKGLKRRLTDSILKQGSILETFKKRSRTDPGPSQSFENESLQLSEESDEELERTRDLDHFLELAREYETKPNIENCDIKSEKERSMSDDEPDIFEVSLDVPVKTTRKIVNVDFSLDDIKKRIREIESKQSYEEDIKIKFRSEVKPEENHKAEEELTKHINKTDFKRMDIIGQFNKGFIITKLENDLFIVDQHATDEKYNFEQLQLTTILDHQKLVNPKPLGLTAGNEAILIENEGIFKKNGFKFIINHDAPTGKKVSLSAIPISKSYLFGRDDIDEMLFMLQDSNDTLIRPSRVRQMFASRACRKSVMIGKSLTTSDMRKLIDHMGEIDQPWNCPHGRPTMRHLINLNLIQI
ncbi:mismatch repair endonuclease PMS2 isoform X2 [Aethina tumida]|uniref:mismatch repair endonuclease PMS2 isoform X2 n=1 Tax=Aethina tumida TaxID=116153 RepID=UPI00096B43D4|nr:mismatch repair endonuclease PMS2 isoform X2 [Aethina tumida]